MVAGCRCHDPLVFGHGEGCPLGPPARSGRPRDFKAEISEQQLEAALRIAREYDYKRMTTMPRSKYAVTGGWLKKRG